MAKKNKLEVLREQLQHVPGVGIKRAETGKQEFVFNAGPAGVTGEVYWALASRKGRKITVLKRPGTTDHPVFKDRRIAEKVVADLERMRSEGQFPEVDQFVAAKLEVGKPSEILRPSAGGIVLPNELDVAKYGG